MVERQTLNLLVKGSIPLRLILKKPIPYVWAFFSKKQRENPPFMTTHALGNLLYDGSAELKNYSSTPLLDVQLLLAHVLACSRGKLLAMQPTTLLTDLQLAQFRSFMRQRMAGITVAYLLNHKEFYGRAFYVDFGVLVPRPDSEVLIEAVLGYAERNTIKTLHDVGTGTGALALTLACELALQQVTASDVSDVAEQIFSINHDRLQAQLNCPVSFVLRSLLDDQSSFCDVIVANLPYLTPKETHVRIEDENWHEPALALDGGGEDGLQLIRKLISQASEYCDAIFLEAAPEQMQAIGEALKEGHFNEIEYFCDLSGQKRVIAGYNIPSLSS